MKSKTAIRLENISFAYPQAKKCIDNISFEILVGEKVLLLGANGTGKSTISKIIDGILKPSSGDVYIFDKKMNDDNAASIREDIGLIFQNPDDQFITSTVREEIAFGLENKQVDPSKMNEIILTYAKKVGMESFLDSDPASLSGGQKQRVSLASFLALKPKILILDEATSMLDPKGKKDVDKIIIEAKEADKELTLIKISHELEDYFFYDKIIIIKDSSILFIGSPSQLINNKEVLNQAKINKPFFLSLIEKLNSKGIKVNSKIESEEKLIQQLCQLKLKN